MIAPRFRDTLAHLRVSAPDVVVTVGGTCGVEAAPVAYLNERYRGDLAVVWYDAHGDLNAPATSPSGHFHGMVLRTLLGDSPKGDRARVAARVGPRTNLPRRNPDLDPDEAAYSSGRRHFGNAAAGVRRSARCVNRHPRTKLRERLPACRHGLLQTRRISRHADANARGSLVRISGGDAGRPASLVSRRPV